MFFIWIFEIIFLYYKKDKEMKKLLFIIGLFISVSVNAQVLEFDLRGSVADTVYVESLTEMDTAIVVNEVIEKSDIDISQLAIEIESQDTTTIEVIGIFHDLPNGVDVIYSIGYIREQR